MERSNYYVVMGFMVKDMKLRGNERDIYAIIYGLTQEGGWYKGSIDYLKEWTVISSKTTVINALNNLVEKGFIEKEHYERNGVKLPMYRARYGIEGWFKNCNGVVQKLNRGGSKIEPNNIADNIDDNYNTNINHTLYKQELLKHNISKQLRDSIVAWFEYKDSKGQSYSSISRETIIRRIINIANRESEEYAIETITSAIAGGLVGINDYKDLAAKREKKRKFMEERYKKKPPTEKHPWEL